MAATRKRNNDDRIVVRCLECGHEFKSRRRVHRRCSACGNQIQGEFEALPPGGGRAPAPKRDDEDEAITPILGGVYVSPDVKTLKDQVTMTILRGQVIMAQGNLERMTRMRLEGDGGGAPSQNERLLERITRRQEAILVILEVLLTNYRAHLHDMHGALSTDLDKALALLR